MSDANIFFAGLPAREVAARVAEILRTGQPDADFLHILADAIDPDGRGLVNYKFECTARNRYLPERQAADSEALRIGEEIEQAIAERDARGSPSPHYNGIKAMCAKYGIAESTAEKYLAVWRKK